MNTNRKKKNHNTFSDLNNKNCCRIPTSLELEKKKTTDRRPIGTPENVRYLPNCIIHFGRAVYGRGLGVREMYEIYTVLFAVDSLGQIALLGVVYDDLIVFTA